MAVDKLSEVKAHLLSRAAEDDDFRSSLLEDPRAAIAAEFGVSLPDRLSFEVHEDTATTAHLILPPTGQLAEAELEIVSGGIAPQHSTQTGDVQHLSSWANSMGSTTRT